MSCNLMTMNKDFAEINKKVYPKKYETFSVMLYSFELISKFHLLIPYCQCNVSNVPRSNNIYLRQELGTGGFF